MNYAQASSTIPFVANDLTLCVLDQSPMRLGGSATEALRESVELARRVEELGYRRYWVAEHHNATSFAGTSPEVLIAQVAAHTRSIRVGSGGVMLSNYSALKIAEQFRVLMAFSPDRLDLGIGRARGGDPLAAEALGHPRPLIAPSEFTQQVNDLLDFLCGTLAPEHPFAKVRAQPGPVPELPPEVWLLGSSPQSAQTAAALGLSFAFAHFLKADMKVGATAIEHYRRSFKASRFLKAPRVCVALEVICAPTGEDARFLALSRNFDAVAVLYNIQGLLPPEQVSSYSLSEEASQFMERSAQRCLTGNPAQIRDQILDLARLYTADEVSLLTNCYAFEDRVRSYALVAASFGNG